MKNWLGQEIEVGSFVGRNANDHGDTKIGQVFALDGRIANIYWLYRCARPWYTDRSPMKLGAKSPGVPAGGGPIDVDRLFLLDPASFGFNPLEWWSE